MPHSRIKHGRVGLCGVDHIVGYEWKFGYKREIMIISNCQSLVTGLNLLIFIQSLRGAVTQDKTIFQNW
jgi:hypothetical protein